jgi:hypothetical protein
LECTADEGFDSHYPSKVCEAPHDFRVSTTATTRTFFVAEEEVIRRSEAEKVG